MDENTENQKSPTNHIQLTIDDFMQYKYQISNMDILTELIDFCNMRQNRQRNGHTHNNHNNHNNHNHNNNRNNRNNKNDWRKNDAIQDQIPKDNWILANKLKQTDDEKLYSNFRSLLNKLSDSNFDVLLHELTSLEIEKSEHLMKLAEFIFNKALVEPKFGYMYAKLARGLVGFSLKEQDKVFYFRELLISKCQMMFNECVTFDTVNTNITRDSGVGCMSFIGELYLCDLLTSKIINSCFMLLLIKADNTKTHLIDFISALMKVVSNTFMSKYPNETKLIFEKIDKLITSGEFQNKDKFALMDLVDLRRSNKW